MTHFLEKLVLTLCFALSTVSTFAASSLDVGDLTEEQRAQLVLKKAELQKESTSGTTATTAQKVSEWVNISQQLGAGLGETAKQLGVAANEFVKTPVGKWTAAVIIWKMVGGAAVHIVGGVSYFLIGLFLWIYLFRRLCVVQSVTEVEGSRFFGLIPNKKYTYHDSGSVDTERTVMAIFAVLHVMVSLVIIFTY